MKRTVFRPAILILGLLWCAFALQLGYFNELQAMFPTRFGAQPFCGVDAEAHLNRALGLLAGTIPGDQVFYFIPLYPLYLATLKTLFGDSLLLPLYLQALLQLTAISGLYRLGRQLFTPLTGLLAALGLASYNYYLFYLPCFDQTLLTTPFLTLAVCGLLRYQKNHRLFILGVSGLCLAIATLSRPTLLTLYPLLGLWLIWRHGRHVRLLWGLLSLMGPFVLLVAPITWHNYQASGRFVLLSNNFAVNFFTGNNPDAYGLDSLAHSQSQPAVVRFIDTHGRVKRGETTLTAEVLAYIRHQPFDWLELTATKARHWFWTADKPLVTPFFPLQVSDSPLLRSLPLTWQALMLSALLGALLVRGRSRERELLLWLLYGTFSMVTIFFFIQLRFRLPFVPFVLLWSAALLAQAGPWLHHQPRKFWQILLILLLFAALIPGLMVHAGLFLLLGWASRPRRVPRWAIGAVGLYLVGLLWWGQQHRAAHDVTQSIDHYLGPPLVGEGVLGQTFLMDCDGLNQIELTMGLFAQPHTHSVTFYLATDPTAQEILYQERFAGANIVDHQRKRFDIPPIPDSAGQHYFFFLSSPSSTPGNALTVRGYSDTPVDFYPHGEALAGRLGHLQRVQADFAFAAYCR